MEDIEQRMWHFADRFEPCLAMCAQSYNGPRFQCVKRNCPSATYEQITLSSQIIANATKDVFFASPHKTSFTAKPIVEAWRLAKARMIPWWQEEGSGSYDNDQLMMTIPGKQPLTNVDLEKKQNDHDTSIINMLSRSLALSTALSNGQNAGLIHYSWDSRTKTNVMQRGMFIDRAFGGELGRNGAALFSDRMMKEYTHQSTGRRINPLHRMIASTSDLLTSRGTVEERDHYMNRVFEAKSTRAYNGGGHRARNGAPILSHEFKSLQCNGSRVPEHKLRFLHDTYRTAERLGAVDDESSEIWRDFKNMAVQEFRNRCQAGKWMPDEMRFRKDAVKKMKMTGHIPNFKHPTSKIHTLFHRKSKLFPTDVIDNTVEIEKTTLDGGLVPYLGDETDHIPLKELLPGYTSQSGGVLAMYTADGNLYHRLRFEKPPFVLAPRSDFLAQMIVQAATLLDYNEAMRFIFTAVLSIEEREAEMKCPGGEQPIRLAMVYSYDTGIDRRHVRRLLRQTYKNMGRADPQWMGRYVDDCQLDDDNIEDSVHPAYREAIVDITGDDEHDEANVRTIGHPSDLERLLDRIADEVRFPSDYEDDYDDDEFIYPDDIETM